MNAATPSNVSARLTSPSPTLPSFPSTPRPPRVSAGRIRAAWRWERRKAPQLWLWIASLGLWGFGLTIGAGQYLSYTEEFVEQGLTWSALWAQSTLLVSIIFLPLILAAASAQTGAQEHAGRNWQRMAAVGVRRDVIAGKLLHTFTTAVGVTTIFYALFIPVGLWLGFPLGEGFAYLVRFVPLALACWQILLAASALSARMTSFAAVMSTALVTTIIGLMMTLASGPLASIFPTVLLTTASGAREVDTITSMGSAFLASLFCCAWVGVWTVFLSRWSARQDAS